MTSKQSFLFSLVSNAEEEEEDGDSMCAAHNPTSIVQGGWREEGAEDKSALNEEMEAETGEYHRVCIYIHVHEIHAVCFVSHVERYLYMYLLLPPFFHPPLQLFLLSSCLFSH